MIFKLKKPRYGWRTYQGPIQPNSHGLGSDLFLSDDVVDWLKVNNVLYDTFTDTTKEADGKTYLYFYIQIFDPQHAMMFKLTWL